MAAAEDWQNGPDLGLSSVAQSHCRSNFQSDPPRGARRHCGSSYPRSPGVGAATVGAAKDDGVELVGPNGLLNQLTANVLETVLEAVMDEHLGYEKHQVEGRGSGNSRNGRWPTTVLTEIGPVEVGGRP